MGLEESPPEPVDTIVSYLDHWMWDMTNYLLQLDIQVIEPNSYTSIAETSIKRTSLSRNDRKHIVREAFSEFFFAPENRKKYMEANVCFDGNNKG